ncbi:putative phosphoenolpyruvate synthase [Ylistrum balloti]|uniref:putative phosphoenolpyruvate synthase n=1 Tax=Ylistrum balloti TaxID=509963 RepID=UPI002905BFBD|nr:putative phosphoenolpyruvate synthase [Ylistrum balloti]
MLEFWSVVVGLLGFLITWQLFRPQSAPICGVYRQPGKWFWLKKLVFLVIIKLRQYRHREAEKRHRRSQELLDKNRGYGAGMLDPTSMETFAPLDPDPFGIDAVYFGGFNKDGVRVIVRYCRRHERRGEIWLFLEIPTIGVLQHPLHPDTYVINTNGQKYSAGGLKIEMIEPMKTWKVSFNGTLRHGLCNELENKGGKLLQVKFSFKWCCNTDPFSFDTDISASAIADAIARENWDQDFWSRLKSKHQTHYEQWGEMTGPLQVEGYDDIQLRLNTVRDHSFGVRDWRMFHRYAIHFIRLESGVTAQVGVVSLPSTTSYLQVGYLNYPCGAMYPVSSCDIKLWKISETPEPANEYSFNFVAGGDTFHVEVKGETTPIWYHCEDRGSKIFEKFCQFKVNGKKGYGLVEFHYRNTDGPSFVLPESLPLLQEPAAELVKATTERLTLTFDEDACGSSKLVGGKGAQLGQLSSIQNKVNCVVPRGFCLTLTAFVKQVEKNAEIMKAVNNIVKAIRDLDDDQLKLACSDTVEHFASIPIIKETEEAILERMKHLFSQDCFTKSFAVRSSASGEDGSEASSAGQMETYLGVRGHTEILDSVRKCWASAFTYQAVQYRRQNGQPIKVAVGVVIQEMVQSEVSGVMFTNDPVNGSPNLMTIDASYGLGEAVVSGKTTPDTISVFRSWDDQLSIKNKNLGDKKIKISVKDEGGLKETETESAICCCLTDEKIIQLSQIALQIETYFGSPRDIEWALSANQFYLLQARPITTLDQDTDEDLWCEFDDALVTHRECLTTANIGEMMPGAVTQLTHSVFLDAVLRGTGYLAKVMAGGPHIRYHAKALIFHNQRSFINMNVVGLISINNIVGKLEAGQLSILGQTVEDLTLEEVKEYVGKQKTFWDRLKVFIRFYTIKNRDIKDFEAWYDRVNSYRISKDVQDAQSLYFAITNKLPDYYRLWRGNIVKSSMSGLWSNVVAGILSKGKSAYTPENLADMALLLSECEEVYSAEVPTAMQELAREISAVGLTDEFLTVSDEDCVQLMTSEKFPKLKQKFDTFISRHGHRYVREAEFFERSWRAKPERLSCVLKTILKTKSFQHKEKEKLSLTEIFEKMQTPINWTTRQVLKWIVPKARKAVGDREWGKSLAVKVSDIFKEAYWQLAELLMKEGRLPEKELMFFLTHSEIGKLLKTRSPRLITKAIKRRRLLPKMMDLSFPKLQSGIPKPIMKSEIEAQRTAHFTLTGMPVMQGTVTSTARVVKDLEQANQNIQAGDILIVSYTDVGWTPYFPLISGLVTELGGLLSHGAVVAREYGLPCIVNVSNATQLFQSGDLVRLNGKTGTIEKLVDEEKMEIETQE